MSDLTIQQPDDKGHEGAAGTINRAPTTEKTLSRSDLNKAWWIWTFFNLSAFSMERMQAPAFVYMMSPIMKRLYGDNPEEIKSALKRHMVFFNTEPQTGVIAHGVTVALEQQRASGAPINDEMINGIKAGIMGPMAGIGDSMIPGTLIPILLAIGISLSQGTGSPIGPIFYIIAYPVIILSVSYYLFMFGYRYGMSSMRELAEAGFRRIVLFQEGDDMLEYGEREHAKEEVGMSIRYQKRLRKVKKTSANWNSPCENRKPRAGCVYCDCSNEQQ